MSKTKVKPKRKKKDNRLDRLRNDIKLHLNCMYDRGDIKNQDYHRLFGLAEGIKK